MLKTISLFAILSASALMAQPTLGAANMNAGWLWPKGVYTLAIHDGPGPRTEDIATLLASTGKVADFFQTLCHYAGQPPADQRSAMCYQQHATPVSLLNRVIAQHQCIGNHGQDHLDTPTLNQTDTVYQIGAPTSFFLGYWEQQNCPSLLTFPGFQTDAQHIAWLKQDSGTGRRQQGPIWADFTGSGAIQTSSGPVTVGSDQDCFTQGFSQQQCLGLMLGAMSQASNGGIIAIHDYNPYAPYPLNPADLKSGYAYDYLAGIINGCQAANNGTPCVWLPPDAIPGVSRGLAASPFSQMSNGSDDFSDRIADVLSGDINGDSFPDVIVPRSDGLYCAINTANGTLYSMQQCLSFTDSGMIASQYWLVDVDGDKLPYVVWVNDTGMVGVKADGQGGFRTDIRVLTTDFSVRKLHDSSIYQNSLRFGAIRSGSLPDIVAMSSLGIVMARNNGNGFDPPRRYPHLAYQANSDWSPEQAGKQMVLVDLLGEGSLDLVIPGNTGLLYAQPVKDGFTVFKPLTAGDGFNYWSGPQFYTSLNATRIGGRASITGWTPVGIAFSDFTTKHQRPAVDQFQILCSDCFLSLQGWLNQWQQSSMTAAPFQAGFADFKNNGAPQAFVVWGTGLYASDVVSLEGYR